MRISPQLAAKGGKYFHHDPYRSSPKSKKLKMNSASLGIFTMSVLAVGGEIISIDPISSRVQNASLLSVVAMTPEMAASFTYQTGFELFPPAKIKLN